MVATDIVFSKAWKFPSVHNVVDYHLFSFKIMNKYTGLNANAKHEFDKFNT